MLKIKGLYLPMLANRICTGDVYFLNSSKSGALDSPGNGKDPDAPFATLDYALGKMTASNDDMLIIGAGHSETITGAGGITLDKAGVTIVGMGKYDTRPTFLMDGATTVTLLATAANVTVENCIFKAGHADIVVFATITAKGVKFINCRIEENVATENFITVFSVGAADNDSDGFTLENCEIIQGDAADLHAIIFNKNQNDVSLIGNRIRGIYDASPYSSVYCHSDEVLANFYMTGNCIYDAQADGQNAPTVNLACTTSTGWVVGNYAQVFDTAAETPFLGGAGGLGFFQNFSAGVAGTASGYLRPAADS